jgi:hypothetical protein
VAQYQLPVVALQAARIEGQTVSSQTAEEKVFQGSFQLISSPVKEEPQNAASAASCGCSKTRVAARRKHRAEWLFPQEKATSNTPC